LVSFDGLEQGLEVAGTEALVIATLNNLEEKRWAILQWLREDLEKVTLVIVVDEDLLALQHIDVLLHLQVGRSHTSTQVVVISVRD